MSDHARTLSPARDLSSHLTQVFRKYLPCHCASALCKGTLLRIVPRMADGESLFEEAFALLVDGEGGESLTKAARLMRKAADEGHTAAANNYRS